MKAALRIVVKGRVQGVGFRWYVCHEAGKLNLTGYVRNMANGDVELFAEGNQDKVNEMIQLVNRGPSLSRVTDIQTEWHEYKGRYKSFEITY